MVSTRLSTIYNHNIIPSRLLLVSLCVFGVLCVCVCVFVCVCVTHKGVGDGVYLAGEHAPEEGQPLGLVLTQHRPEGVAAQPHAQLIRHSKGRRRHLITTLKTSYRMTCGRSPSGTFKKASHVTVQRRCPNS